MGVAGWLDKTVTVVIAASMDIKSRRVPLFRRTLLPRSSRLPLSRTFQIRRNMGLPPSIAKSCFRPPGEDHRPIIEIPYDRVPSRPVEKEFSLGTNPSNYPIEP